MFTKIHIKFLYIFLCLFIYLLNSNAHEFWIEPSQYQLNDFSIKAHLRVGQQFQGMVLMYNPKGFKTFKILSLLSINISFHIIGSEAAILVKSLKPPALY